MNCRKLNNILQEKMKIFQICDFCKFLQSMEILSQKSWDMYGSSLTIWKIHTYAGLFVKFLSIILWNRFSKKQYQHSRLELLYLRIFHEDKNLLIKRISNMCVSYVCMIYMRILVRNITFSEVKNDNL